MIQFRGNEEICIVALPRILHVYIIYILIKLDVLCGVPWDTTVCHIKSLLCGNKTPIGLIST